MEKTDIAIKLIGLLKDEIGRESWEAYETSVRKPHWNQLGFQIARLYTESPLKFIDGDEVVLTVDDEYQREVVTLSDGRNYYKTDIHAFWMVDDVDSNTYYFTLVSHNESPSEKATDRSIKMSKELLDMVVAIKSYQTWRKDVARLKNWENAHWYLETMAYAFSLPLFTKLGFQKTNRTLKTILDYPLSEVLGYGDEILKKYTLITYPAPTN